MRRRRLWNDAPSLVHLLAGGFEVRAWVSLPASNQQLIPLLLPIAPHHQDMLGVPRGTIRATCLIETLLASFEMVGRPVSPQTRGHHKRDCVDQINSLLCGSLTSNPVLTN